MKERYGRWTVIKYSGRDSNNCKLYLCRCDCGTERNVRSINLNFGNTNSCGCLAKENRAKANTAHGHSTRIRKTPEYRSWSMAKMRCTNPANKSYARYGRRGIKMCESWAKSFEQFLSDMGPRPQGTTLGRKDNDGNYQRSNCFWATAEEQQNNQSRNRMLTFNGKTQTASQWGREIGISPHKILNRIDRSKWPIEKALTP